MALRELDRSSLQTFVDDLEDPAAILDGDDRFVYVNAAALSLLHQAPDALIGSRLGEVCPETARRGRKPGTSQVLECHCEPSDSWFETTFGRISASFTLALSRDVTDRKRDVELREHLFGILGHEIRNPLAAISLSLSLFDGAQLSDAQQRSIERIGNCVRSLRRLTGDILDVARSRVGTPLPIDRRPANMGAICREIIDELHYHGRAIELTVDGAVDGAWDQERIGQVMTNLLLNAIQYSHPGSAIRVAVAAEVDGVRVEIANRGDALSPALLPRIFDPLRRAELSRNDGMGLGLYIVRLIVHAHAGDVSVESSESETRFRLRLPYRGEDEGLIAAGQPSA